MSAKSIVYDDQILIIILYNICPYILCIVLIVFVIIVLNVCLCAAGIVFVYVCIKSQIITLDNSLKCDVSKCTCTYSHKS
jgi:hypothetical protein